MNEKYYVYAGSYNDARNDGIYLFQLNRETGKLTSKESYGHVLNPSYLTTNVEYLYSVGELAENSTITWFKRDEDGRLVFVNQIQTNGTYMCHLAIHPIKDLLSAACYGDGNFKAGSLVVCSIEDGDISIPSYERTMPGKGFLNETRQECSHIHSTGFIQNGKYIYVVDLGLDKVYFYEIAENGTIKPVENMRIDLPEGEGPRHIAISKSESLIFVATELGSNVFVYEFDKANIKWIQKQCIRTVSSTYNGENYPAEICISHDEQFLYVSNRGENTLSVFSIDGASGELTHIENCPCGGDWPRHFCITDDDRYVLIANQYSGNISVFSRNDKSGLLEEMTDSVNVPNASCVKVSGT